MRAVQPITITADTSAGSSGALPPDPIRLDGSGEFKLEPTLDSRWGDSRLPVTDDTMGPEARILRYHREDEHTGDCRVPEHDDSEWERTTVDFGPRSMLPGPVPADGLSGEQEDGIAGRPLVDPSVDETVAGAPRDWRENRAELEAPIRPKSAVTVRLEHVPERYVGAGFPEPVRLECCSGIDLRETEDIHISHLHADNIGGLEYIASQRYNRARKPRRAGYGSPWALARSSIRCRSNRMRASNCRGGRPSSSSRSTSCRARSSCRRSG